jgi:NitT/TauT family transport system substrate-binding protein
VRPEAGIATVADLDGKTIATPQLGNTQDVALRAYLLANGLDSTENGGDVKVQPTANADTLTLFQRGDIDGAWVPEPWASRLETEAGGVEFLDERELWPNGEFVTTHLIVATEFLEERPDIVARLIAAHIDVTRAIEDDAETAKQQVNDAIEELTTAALTDEVIDSAWGHLTFTWDPIAPSLLKSAEDAAELGFIDEPDLDGIYALDLLNAELAKANEATVGGSP